MSVAGLATVVDWTALWQSVAASFAAGVGITVAFAISVYGATRAVELRRDERPAAAGLAATVMALGLAVSIAGLVLGVVAMTSK